MKVNFKRFPCYIGIRKDNRIEADLQESMAELIYKSIPGCAASSLAHRIYESNDGDVELTDNDVSVLRRCCELLTGIYADSVNDWLDELEKKENNNKEEQE